MYLFFLPSILFLLTTYSAFSSEELEKPNQQDKLYTETGYQVGKDGVLTVYNLEEAKKRLPMMDREEGCFGKINFCVNKPIDLDQFFSFTESLHTARAIQESLDSHPIHFSEKDESKNSDQSEEVKEIKRFLEIGFIRKESTPPRFFDDLFSVIENNPVICKNVKQIEIYLCPKKDYSRNKYNISSVLNYLIAGSNLESINLSHFNPEMLVASLASISSQTSLKNITFMNNSLDVHSFREIVARLPFHKKLRANFSHNHIKNDDVELLKFIVSSVTQKISLLRINPQIDLMSGGSIELNETIKALQEEVGDLEPPVSIEIL